MRANGSRFGVGLACVLVIAACSGQEGAPRSQAPVQSGHVAGPAPQVVAPAPGAGRLPGEWEMTRKRARHRAIKQRVGRVERRGFTVSNVPAKPLPLP